MQEITESYNKYKCSQTIETKSNFTIRVSDKCLFIAVGDILLQTTTARNGQEEKKTTSKHEELIDVKKNVCPNKWRLLYADPQCV